MRTTTTKKNENKKTTKNVTATFSRCRLFLHFYFFCMRQETGPKSSQVKFSMHVREEAGGSHLVLLLIASLICSCKVMGLGLEQLLYADNDILAYNKPANMLSVPGIYEKDSLATHASKTFALDHIDKTIVHRLDYHTSGVILFARNEFALRNLNHQLRSKSMPIYKRYCAVVSGRLMSFSGQIDIPLGRDFQRGSPFNKVNIEKGKESFTRWNLRGFLKNNT